MIIGSLGKGEEIFNNCRAVVPVRLAVVPVQSAALFHSFVRIDQKAHPLVKAKGKCGTVYAVCIRVRVQAPVTVQYAVIIHLKQ